MAEPSGKVKRGVSISAKTNADLVELCETLGVNIHSYMVNEIAKAIQRDRLTLSLTKNQQDTMVNMEKIFEEAMRRAQSEE